jgi:hypothetical protein
MRARHRPLKVVAAAAALTAASLPLWAAPAGAGGSPDESHTSLKTVTVNGVACEVRLSSARFGDFVQGFTQVITTASACATQRISVGVEFETPHGDTAGAAADGSGALASVAGSGAVDLLRSSHIVVFSDGTSGTWTMQSK